MTSYLYSDKSQASPPFTIDIFEDVGRAFCIALLDFVEKNPVTRIATSTYKNLDGVKAELVSMHRILIPKKLPLAKDARGSQSFNGGKPALLAKKPQSSQPRSQSLQ